VFGFGGGCSPRHTLWLGRMLHGLPPTNIVKDDVGSPSRGEQENSTTHSRISHFRAGYPSCITTP
jgi:hypothetical protein